MASNIVRLHVALTGTRPLLWHVFGPDAIPLEKQERTGVAGNDPEEWKKTVTVTKEGQLYLPSTYAFGCIRDAARHTRKGKGSIQAAVVATLQVETDRLLFDRYMPEAGALTRDPEQPVYLDVQSVRNPSTKGRNVRYRVAASAGWRTSFVIFFDKTVVTRDEMRAVIRDAGTLTGIGDGRNIGYGRFTAEVEELTAESGGHAEA